VCQCCDVSLWAVSNNYTAELMINFYKAIAEKKMNKGQSLRDAMLKCRQVAADPK